MNNEDKFKITSNEYIELIATNEIAQNIQNTFPDVSLFTIDDFYKIVYIPTELFTSNIFYKYGYITIPKIYGLMSIHSELDSYPSNMSFNTSNNAPFSTPNNMPFDKLYNTPNNTPFDKLYNTPKSKPYNTPNNIPISAPINMLNITPNNVLTGQGVLLGFVDTGIEYTHQAFRNPNNTTRIVSIWDQTIESDINPEGFYYGTEYKREQINAALGAYDPLSVVPSVDELGHGTILAGIAGGSYNAENGFVGAAPNTEFVVVKLKQAKPFIKDFYYLPQDTICYQENDIMLGIKYLTEIASEMGRPIIITVGLGTSQGAHSGFGILDNYMSRLGVNTNFSFVVAAGNEGRSNRHFQGQINPSIGYNDVYLVVEDNTLGFFMEFWGNAPNVYVIDVYSPTDEFLGRIPELYNQRSTIELTFDHTTIFVDYSVEEETISGEQFVLFRMKTPNIGTWKLRAWVLGNLSATFHLWLPITNFLSGVYFEDASPYTTITHPGNKETLITVTAYNSMTNTIYSYASKGPTKDNIPKPDIAAPGVNVLTPAINNQYTLSTGTSVSAAYAAGKLSMLLEWAAVRGNLTNLSNASIRSLLISGAIRQPDIVYPNPEWGFGILDINNTIRRAEDQII